MTTRASTSSTWSTPTTTRSSTRVGATWAAGWPTCSADALLDKPRGLYLSSFRCMSAFPVSEVNRNTGPYPYVDGLIMRDHPAHRQPEGDAPAARGIAATTSMRKLVRLWLSIFLNFFGGPLRMASRVRLVLAVLGLMAFTRALRTRRSSPGHAARLGLGDGRSLAAVGSGCSCWASSANIWGACS